MGPDWDLQAETIALHGGWAPDPATTARACPCTGRRRTSSAPRRRPPSCSLSRAGEHYTRLQNPTSDVLEKRMALLEAVRSGGLAVASGTNAAFYSIINLASAGDNIVAAQQLYGGTYTQFNDILPSLGIEVRFVDVNDPEAFKKAADKKTRAFFCETVANPSLDIADLDAISAAAHSLGLPLVVDDTFTTPALLKPFDHGADVVVNSLTKWTGGHGTGVGGIVIDSGKVRLGGCFGSAAKGYD